MAFYKVTKKQEGGGGGTTKDVAYLKWQILKTRTANPSNGAMQVKEFYLYQNSERYSWDSNVSITSNMAGNTNQEVSKLIDDNKNTKYCTPSWGSSQSNECNIVISLGETITLDCHSTYSFFTAEDETSRDPIAWKLFGSSDGTNWELLDEKDGSGYVPSDRNVETRSFPMSEVGGGGSTIQYKNYAKFDGIGITLPFTINSDYKVSVTYHQTNYFSPECIIGNTSGAGYSHFTIYNYQYWSSAGTGESGWGTWSAGEHTFVTNDGNGYNTLDGNNVQSYTPTTASGTT